MGRGGLEQGALPLQSQTGLTPTIVGPPCPLACSAAFPGEEPQALSLKLLTIKMKSGWSSPSRGENGQDGTAEHQGPEHSALGVVAVAKEGAGPSVAPGA